MFLYETSELMFYRRQKVNLTLNRETSASYKMSEAPFMKIVKPMLSTN